MSKTTGQPNVGMMGYITRKGSGSVTGATAANKRAQFARMETGGLTRANTDIRDMLIDEPQVRNNKVGAKATMNYDAMEQPSPPQRDRNHFDYGARKRMPMSAADKKDKIIEFERENNTLKEKENFLQTEIKMLTTKLRRVEGLIK